MEEPHLASDVSDGKAGAVRSEVAVQQRDGVHPAPAAGAGVLCGEAAHIHQACQTRVWRALGTALEWRPEVRMQAPFIKCMQHV